MKNKETFLEFCNALMGFNISDANGIVQYKFELYHYKKLSSEDVKNNYHLTVRG